jgi:hypothetical protein
MKSLSMLDCESVRAIGDSSTQEATMNQKDNVPSQQAPNGDEPAFSEDDLQRAQLGPRGVPGQPDPARMTPQRAKKTPKGKFDGHTA